MGVLRVDCLRFFIPLLPHRFHARRHDAANANSPCVEESGVGSRGAVCTVNSGSRVAVDPFLVRPSRPRSDQLLIMESDKR